MSDNRSGEEIVAICSNCEAVYPAIRFPDGDVKREGSLPYCRCGSESLVEIGYEW